MRKYIFITFILSCFYAFSPAQGFQMLFWPNLNQYDHLGFYIDANRMLIGGSYYHPTTLRTTGLLMKADTSATVQSGWSLDEPNGWGPRNFRRFDASNTLISGGSSTFPNGAFLGKVNHVTGAVGFSKNYSSNVAFGNATQANDAIVLGNGDIAMVAQTNENKSSTPCPSTLCVGPNGYGYLKAFFGTNSYGRSDDICLIRTDAGGDSLWVKKYHLAYDNSGAFVWCSSPAFGADSSRMDIPTRVMELNGDLFITGFTIDYYRSCMGMPWDPQTFLLKVNSAGVVQWCKTYSIGNSPQNEYGVDLAPVTSDASNDVIVLSRSDGSGNVELCRVANATGNLVWARSFDFGYSERGWGMKVTADGRYVIAITASGTPIGSYDMILLKIDRNGNYLNAKGMGTANMDGTDSWAWYGPNADVFSQGSYAIAGVSNYSGGPTGSSYVCKVMNQTFSTACPSKEFNITSITMIDRNVGGANQLRVRTPLVYETRGGMNKSDLALVSAPIVPTATSACLLPVELLSFSGVKSAHRQVLLNWITASEQNNSHFILERSTDNIDFIPITTVAGAGNSNSNHSYEFPDNELPASPVLYYRLKQFDFDGTSTVSNVISVEPDDDELFSVFVDEKENNVSFIFTLDRPQQVLIELQDVLGKTMFSKVIMADKGFNKSISSLTGISGGFYLCSFSTTTKKMSRKICYRQIHD